ncbi:MAG: glycosyltransferase [Betaproteobacteria bacterium]|nr:glycosyltransferase [Betaproteobacteria bacterium]
MLAVSVIIVNHFSAPLVSRAVRSVLDQEVSCEVIVVDNSADENEARTLKAGLPDTVRVVVNAVNTGFARACNQAFASSSGEAVLLLNPDAYLLPGALAVLLAALRSEASTGAVGPKVFWDAGRQFLMPPSTFPSLAGRFWNAASRCCSGVGGLHSRRFRAFALRYWQSDRPVSVPALSGGHVLLKRSALLAAGGLFDERFFLYWEDSDLMQRLRSAGYRLYMIPQALAVHEYTHSPEKDRLISAGWLAYEKKHFQPNGLARWLRKLFPESRPAAPFPLLKPCYGTVTFFIPPAWTHQWLLEVSPNPDFVPAIGQIGRGGQTALPAPLRERFSGGVYYARLTPCVSWPVRSLCWRDLNTK